MIKLSCSCPSVICTGFGERQWHLQKPAWPNELLMTTDCMGNREKWTSQIQCQYLFKITSMILPAPFFHAETHTSKCFLAFKNYCLALCHSLMLLIWSNTEDDVQLVQFSLLVKRMSIQLTKVIYSGQFEECQQNQQYALWKCHFLAERPFGFSIFLVHIEALLPVALSTYFCGKVWVGSSYHFLFGALCVCLSPWSC